MYSRIACRFSLRTGLAIIICGALLALPKYPITRVRSSAETKRSAHSKGKAATWQTRRCAARRPHCFLRSNLSISVALHLAESPEL